MRVSWQLGLGFVVGVVSGVLGSFGVAVAPTPSPSDERVLAAIAELHAKIEAGSSFQRTAVARSNAALNPNFPANADGVNEGEAKHAKPTNRQEDGRIEPATARDLERATRAPAVARELVNQAMATKSWRAEDRQRLAILMPYLGSEGPALRGYLIAALNAGRLSVEPGLSGMPF